MATDGNLLSERFNGGADGAAVTTSTSSINAVAYGTPTHESTDRTPVEGSACMKCLQDSNNAVRFDFSNSGSTPIYFSWYHYSSHNPTNLSSHVIASVVSSSFANRAQIRQRSNGALDIRNGTTSQDISDAIPAGTDLRLEWLLNWGAGAQTLNIYKGANKHGSVPDEVLTGSLTNTDRARLLLGAHGALSDVVGSYHLIDYFDADTTGFVDPAPAPVEMDAGPDQVDVRPFTTVTLDSSASLEAGDRTWTHRSGPSNAGMLDDFTAISPNYEAPGTLAGATDVWRVTDDASGEFDEVSVEILPAGERAVIGGVEVPVPIRSVQS